MKIYPEINCKFAVVNNDSLHINFTTNCNCDNGEIFEVNERYIIKHEDPIKIIELIIDYTNRFHVICQSYIKQTI